MINPKDFVARTVYVKFLLHCTCDKVDNIVRSQLDVVQLM